MLVTSCFLIPNPGQSRDLYLLRYEHILTGKSERSIINISIPDATVVVVLLKEIITIPSCWWMSQKRKRVTIHCSLSFHALLFSWGFLKQGVINTVPSVKKKKMLRVILT